jgi:BlaI family penicillinase repressor
MRTIPRISEAEWEIMKTLWETAPMTANEIVEKISEKMNWKPKTIKTLINRLLKKQVISFDKKERGYSYYPIIAKADCILAENQSFLDRVYEGEFSVMMASFLHTRQLAPEEIEKLKQILEQKKMK